MNAQQTKCFCNRCNQQTNHKVSSGISKTLTDEDDPDLPVAWAKGTFQILECLGCGSVTFKELWISSEDDLEDLELGERAWFYPPRTDDSIAVKNFGLLFEEQHKIETLYGEVVSTYNNRNFTLCAAGIRAIIEGICGDKGVTDGPVIDTDRNGNQHVVRRKNLKGKINGLAEKHLLSDEHAKTLHQLRFLGNEALHDLVTPDRKDLKTAIEIVEHTMENLYLLPEKAKGLGRKRKQRP